MNGWMDGRQMGGWMDGYIFNFPTWQASFPPLSGPAHRTVVWERTGLWLWTEALTVWRTCLHLAGFTKSSWTSLRTREGRPSGRPQSDIVRFANCFGGMHVWFWESHLLSFTLPHPPMRQLLSEGMASSNRGRHTGRTRLPVVTRAVVR